MNFISKSFCVVKLLRSHRVQEMSGSLIPCSDILQGLHTPALRDSVIFFQASSIHAARAKQQFSSNLCSLSSQFV
jgi:hypothetical protein